MYLFRKKHKNKKEYGVNRRVLSVLIDMLIIAILFYPAFVLVSNIIYRGTNPAQLINTEIMSYVADHKDHKTSYIDVLDYIKNNGVISKIFYEQNLHLKILFDMSFQLLCIFLFFLVFWIKKGYTSGKYIFKLRVVDYKTGGKPTKEQCFKRILGYLFVILTLGLGFFIILLNKENRSLADYIAGTKIVKIT